MKKMFLFMAGIATAPFAESVTDNYGNHYQTTIINTQEWITSNIKARTGNYQESQYGLLYDWNTAQKVCPTGWRLPSKDDWEELIAYIEPISDYAPQNASSGWDDFTNGIDLWGLSFVPDGHFYKGQFAKVGRYAFIWSSTSEKGNNAYYANVKEKIRVETDFRDVYKSVRCMRKAKSAPKTVDHSIGSITDKQGNSYPIVKIGDQTWTAKNLALKTPDSYCHKSNCKKYGRLYTREEALTACPDGFRLPSGEDFETLFNYAGNGFGPEKARRIAPFHLKATNAWDEKESKFVLDNLGFSALPAGVLDHQDGQYKHIENIAVFWTYSLKKSGVPAVAVIGNKAELNDIDAASKLSIRCIQANKNEMKEYKKEIEKIRKEAKAARQGNAESSKDDSRDEHIAEEEARTESVQASTPKGNRGRDVKTRDGKIYPTVKIGGQIWMAKNMERLTEQSRCPGKSEDNCERFGRLYTYADASTVCPAGWRLPSDEDVEILLDFISGTAPQKRHQRDRNLRIQGKTMKSRLAEEGFNDNEEDTKLPFFWTSTEMDNGMMATYSFNGEGPQDAKRKGTLRYTRCIRDLPKK